MRLPSLPRRGVNLVLALVGVGALLIGGSRSRTASFEDSYPGFEAFNRALRGRLIARPRSRHRDQALAVVEENLRWAAAYRRLGFDPDVFEELAFERELAQRDQAGVR